MGTTRRGSPVAHALASRGGDADGCSDGGWVPGGLMSRAALSRRGTQ